MLLAGSQTATSVAPMMIKVLLSIVQCTRYDLPEKGDRGHPQLVGIWMAPNSPNLSMAEMTAGTEAPSLLAGASDL